MNTTLSPELSLPRDLGDGLTLRRAQPGDLDALAELNSTVLVDPTRAVPDEGEACWTRDLLRGDHPTVAFDDYTLVEDRATGRLVSAMNLISQVWSYGGVHFGVGRPEGVVTRPEYRRKGLVRAQMEALHARSAAKGELVQAITGIPFFYRQFGYEMAVTLGGGREAAAINVPRLEGSAPEPYRFRPATTADAGWISAVDTAASERSLLSCVRADAEWRYEIAGKSPGNWTRAEMWVIESGAGDRLGFVGNDSHMSSNRLGVAVAELGQGRSWLPIVPSLLRHLWAQGERLAARDGKQMQAITFELGPEHPLFEVAPKRLAQVCNPYAWYLRVADLPVFLVHIAPVLAKRLSLSPVVGYTGALKVGFYRGGLRLRLEEGELIGVDRWQPSHEDPGDAAFPGLIFLQLLFGYRSLPELRDAFPDCWTENDESEAVLRALFPKQPSNVWPLA